MMNELLLSIVSVGDWKLVPPPGCCCEESDVEAFNTKVVESLCHRYRVSRVEQKSCSGFR